MHNTKIELQLVILFNSLSFPLPKDTTPHGLRKVHIPGELISHFLRLASDNTRKNLETCGILAGRLVSRSLFWCLLVSFELLNSC